MFVLGAAAGGGLPQWNCNGEISARSRRGDVAVSARTQSSIAVTADNRRWLLFDAAPDLRQQITASPALHPSPSGAARNSPIAAVFLSGGDVDKIAGLLHLRERHPFIIYATAPVLRILSDNPIFNALDGGVVRRCELPLDEEYKPTDITGAPLGIRLTAFAVSGKVPLFMETDEEAAQRRRLDGEAVGFHIADADASFFYIPGCARIDDALRQRLQGAPLVFFDGTLFADDEMIQQGLGEKTGARMGHVSMSGADGAMAALADCGINRKIFIHINNSNPALAEESRQRAEVEKAGWEIAADGMELVL